MIPTVSPASGRRRTFSPRFRPGIEGLEDRTVMSTAVATSAATLTAAEMRQVRLAAHAEQVHERQAAAFARHEAAVARQQAAAQFRAAHATAMAHNRARFAPKAHAITAPVIMTPVMAAPVMAPPAPATTTPAVMPTATAPKAAAADPTVLDLKLNPIDVNLLGLEVKTSAIEVKVSAQPGSGLLLGNLLTDLSGLLNTSGINTVLNNVLGNVVTLVNGAGLAVGGVNAGSTAVPVPSSTTPLTVLNVTVAPVNLNLLGAVVQAFGPTEASPIQVQLIAHPGPGNLLGNVVVDLANILNGPTHAIHLSDITKALDKLLGELGVAAPAIQPSPTTPAPAPTTGDTRILSLVVPPIDLNLLGLVLQTQQITVNADAQSGDGNLLGNLLSDLLKTLDASQTDLTNLNNALNALLGKVVGILNASNLTLAAGALTSLSPLLQTLATTNQVDPAGTTPTPVQVLNLDISYPNGSNAGPPVNVDLLGLVVTTSNIDAQLIAQPGNGQLLGNLVYNVAHLLDPNGALGLISILTGLGGL